MEKVWKVINLHLHPKYDKVFVIRTLNRRRACSLQLLNAVKVALLDVFPLWLCLHPRDSSPSSSLVIDLSVDADDKAGTLNVRCHLTRM